MEIKIQSMKFQAAICKVFAYNTTTTTLVSIIIQWPFLLLASIHLEGSTNGINLHTHSAVKCNCTYEVHHLFLVVFLLRLSMHFSLFGFWALCSYYVWKLCSQEGIKTFNKISFQPFSSSMQNFTLLSPNVRNICTF